MYARYAKLKFLEGFIANIATKLKKAAPRFELVKDQLRLTNNKFFQVSREEISYPFPTSNSLF